MANEVLETIKSRRSVRAYKRDVVPQELLREICEAGTYAPTGGGRQSPTIIAVTTEKYRNELVPGTRTFGYGSPSLIMGECENDEFGNYTRYAFNSCDACIVITIDDKKLVINGKTEELTKEIYDELTLRINK